MHDTLFRDETSKFVTQAKTGSVYENSKSVSPRPRTGKFKDDGAPNLGTDFSLAPSEMAECTGIVTRSLSTPLEDEATCYFFQNFVSDFDPSLPSSSQGFIHAYTLVLPTLYQQDSSSGVLPKIIDAIGLAGISNIKHSPELMFAAGQKYAKVLRAINASIQDSKQRSRDQTLIAIMLLGLFEVLQYLEIISTSCTDRCTDCYMFRS